MSYLIIDTIKEFFVENDIAKIALDIYFTLIIISLIVFIAFKIRKAMNLVLIGLLMLLIWFISKELNLEVATKLYTVVLGCYIIIAAMIIAPELRKLMEVHKRIDNKTELIVSSTHATKEAIVDAVFNMSAVKVGALITIEQHNSLEQYAERAIQLNSDISRELLEQIFIKDSPLHDGGVIIRGNKIICAGAYYVLTQDETLDKTIGSRHRAAVGISEVTDSLTIIVSEETGVIHVANAGFMKIMDSKNELLEYLNLFLGRS